jgi:hypothetical protein
MRKKRAYGSRRAPGELSLEGRVEGSAPHSSLKGQSERREAHSVSYFRCSRIVRFSGYPQYGIYIYIFPVISAVATTSH